MLDSEMAGAGHVIRRQRGGRAPSTMQHRPSRRAGFWRTRFSRSGGRQTGRGSRRRIRFARLERELMTPLRAGALERMTPFHIAVLIAASVARRPRVAAPSPMSGASLAATEAAACARQTLACSSRAERIRGWQKAGSQMNSVPFAPARSSPPSIVPRPCVAARRRWAVHHCRRRRRIGADAKRSSSLLRQRISSGAMPHAAMPSLVASFATGVPNSTRR